MGSYIDFDAENNNKDPKFKFAGHVIISKYKNIFAKGYTSNWSEGIFLSKKLKLPHYGHMLLLILTMEKLLERLHNMRQYYLFCLSQTRILIFYSMKENKWKQNK